MTYRDDGHGAGRNFGVVQDVPEALGWQRKTELDDANREAWELHDGTVLLLDPSGRSDARVCRPRREQPSAPWFAAGVPALNPT